MHILFTDLLRCPRCGPDHGLILLADAMAERRVAAGRLGCANCREEFPIQKGVADLRLHGSSSTAGPPAAAFPPDERAEAALRLAALLGLGESRGMVVLAGPHIVLGAELSRLVPEIEVVGVVPQMHGEVPDGVAVLLAEGLPFAPGSLEGIALAGAAGAADAIRPLRPGGRLVVQPAPPETGSLLLAAGGNILLDQDGTVVAAVPAGR